MPKSSKQTKESKQAASTETKNKPEKSKKSKAKQSSKRAKKAEPTHEAQRTVDHDEIREWAEKRGGKPAAVANTHKDEDLGIVRIAFQDETGDLEDITWEELFETFEEKNLAFLHQDHTRDGEISRFFKFVRR